MNRLSIISRRRTFVLLALLLAGGLVTAQNTNTGVTIEGNVFGGGNQGKVNSNPKVTVGYTDSSKSATVLGSVYGAGNQAKVTGNTNVILQGNADIRTNVFGGGKSADVEGSTNVILKEQ